MNDGHSCTSMAVKKVISEVKAKLATRFSFLPGMPEFFYDFDKGLSDQFKQYYAKVAANDKLNQEWIVLSYSYDSANRSEFQPRRGFSLKRPITNNAYRDIDVTYASLPLLISVLTTNSKLLNALTTFVATKLDWSFTTKFEDMLWPTWMPNRLYPAGWYIRPSIPNGHIYMCSTSGVSGTVEPEWQTTVGQVQQDNEATWECKDIDLIEVKAGQFVKNDTVIQNPIEQGIMYQYDFGYTLHYADLEDNGNIIGTIEKVQLTLMNMPGTPQFMEILTVPD